MSAIAFLCLLAPQAAAEETLRKIEETLLQAETLQLKVKVEAKVRYRGQELINRGSGSLVVRKDNRLAFTFQLNVGQVDLESRVLSDGARMRIWADGKERGETAADPALAARVVSTLVRGGFSSIGQGLPKGGKNDPDLSTILRISNVRDGATQGDLRSVSYTLKTALPEEMTHEVSLWFDAKTLRPILRTFSARARDADVTTTETYDDLTLGREVAEATFALPPPAPQPKSKGPKPPTKVNDPWEGKTEGSWYRFKRVRDERETYMDVGLKSRETGANLLVGQTAEKGEVAKVETRRAENATATVLRQETLHVSSRDYVCDVVETAGVERSWVVREGRYAGATLRSVTAVGVYQAKTVWEHTLKVKGRDFECLVIEAELKMKDKTLESKTWFSPAVPMRQIRIVAEGDTFEMTDFGTDWSARPAFPGAPDRQL